MDTLLYILFLSIASASLHREENRQIKLYSSCNEITQDGLYYIKPTEDGAVIPVICSRGYTMIDLSLDSSMESLSEYLESWNLGTTNNGRMQPYFDEEVPFSTLWLPSDQFTKYRIAPECTSCEMTGVHTHRSRKWSWLEYCNCYKPIQSPSVFTVDVDELPLVTLSDFNKDDLYIDHHIMLKTGRKKQKHDDHNKQRHLDVMGPSEVELGQNAKSTPHIRIHDVFRTTWIAAAFWSLVVVLCILIAAFSYTKCEPMHRSTSTETESEMETGSGSVLPGSDFWIRC